MSRGLLGLAGAFLALLEQNAGVLKTIVLSTKNRMFHCGHGQILGPPPLQGLLNPKPSISVLFNCILILGPPLFLKYPLGHLFGSSSFHYSDTSSCHMLPPLTAHSGFHAPHALNAPFFRRGRLDSALPHSKK